MMTAARKLETSRTDKALAVGDQPHLPFELPPLPYDKSALEPTVSADTLNYHHGKHHKAYIDKTNELAKKAGMENKSLVEIIKAAAGKDDKDSKTLFNNAAQAWNHTFYWHSMKPKGGGKPTGKLAATIEKDFGSFEAFAKEFTEAATTQFGSGWAWLVVDGGKLKVMKTGNAETPIAKGKTPLITIDVWEHAYYLDYQNKRPDYVKAWLEKVVNWEFAAENFASAK
jgi:Fe-Mn family superoxide dismutase